MLPWLFHWSPWRKPFRCPPQAVPLRHPPDFPGDGSCAGQICGPAPAAVAFPHSEGGAFQQALARHPHLSEEIVAQLRCLCGNRSCLVAAGAVRQSMASASRAAMQGQGYRGNVAGFKAVALEPPFPLALHNEEGTGPNVADKRNLGEADRWPVRPRRQTKTQSQ